ncbi:MAG: uroporphyrinogen-III C-methyltransferase [Alphaproteobacteria bacterium]|nr:uroporphyrinogen-III C-methyltransferase [Alphaproteobacteria bacterium]MDE2112433.1 uroporphyrinogen-III C-methyltransferase [Alphaproteobacteria bacterium]MDE2494064.1 uroporphyrinogen-III C-methyltransferase [Alphaproteobacteria bacterium]
MSRDLINAAERAAIQRLADILALPVFERGWVWLAGAGPGDPGLITALGLHAISSSDIILYDALVNEALLKLARPGAELIFAGKRAGKQSCKQSDISHMLVSVARKGMRVLRLKGGDPFVFGRGAEEALTLARAGVPFRVVPGVTAGIGGLAYAGIPATHRDTNHVVTFVTGHGADGKLPDIDWTSIAHGSPTIVLYMARKHAGEIAEKLISAGRDAGEAAAVVSNASCSDQTVHVTTLSQLGVASAGSATPAILVIGESVKLRARLDWIGALAGNTRGPEPLQLVQVNDAG